jgi:hypothetical protein
MEAPRGALPGLPVETVSVAGIIAAAVRRLSAPPTT